MWCWRCRPPYSSFHLCRRRRIAFWTRGYESQETSVAPRVKSHLFTSYLHDPWTGIDIVLRAWGHSAGLLFELLYGFGCGASIIGKNVHANICDCNPLKRCHTATDAVTKDHGPNQFDFAIPAVTENSMHIISDTLEQNAGLRNELSTWMSVLVVLL